MQKVLNKKMSRPLEGLTVLEFSQFLSGPYAGLRLSDLGARVIKIESPIGDDARQFGPFIKGKSTYFSSLNRNKESISLCKYAPCDFATFAGRYGS